MEDNILFYEKFKIGEKEREITVRTSDATSAILKKALDIEFKGEIKVYQNRPPKDKENLPETYFQTFYNHTEYGHANNTFLTETDFYSVYVITRNAGELETLCKKVCKTLRRRGFCITDNGTDVESSDGDGYVGKMIEVEFLRG